VRVEYSSFPNPFPPRFSNELTTTSDIIACDSNNIFDNVRVTHFVDWPFDIDLRLDHSRASCRPTSYALPSHGKIPESLAIESC